MDAFLTTAGSVTLIKAIVDFVKYVRARDVNGWATQLTVWVAGLVVMALLRTSDLAATIVLADVPLDQAQIGTLILAGLGLGSSAMFVNEIKNAIDNTSTAKKPPLVP
jgi:hypothetical protein